jgi:hypothetical protein
MTSVPGSPILNNRVKASLNTLDFFWQPPTNNGGLAITNYRLKCPEISYDTTFTSNTFHARVSSLTNTQDYVFQVAAINSVGEGPYSVFPVAQPGKLSDGVTNLAVELVNDVNAAVSWNFQNKVDEATNKFFALNVYPSVLLSSFRIPLYPTEHSYLVSNLSTSMNYRFSVQPINDAGWSYENTSVVKFIGESLPTSLQTAIILNAFNYSGSGDWLDESGKPGLKATLGSGSRLKNDAGNGILFNGLTHWTFPAIDIGNEWSVSVWCKNITIPNGVGASILSQNNETNLAVVMHDLNILNIAFRGGGIWQTTGAAAPSITITQNKWVNIQGTWNGAVLKTYIDGVLIDSVNRTGPSTNSGQPYIIGRRSNGDIFITGEIGSIIIYKVAITAGQVLVGYNQLLERFP